MGQILDMRSALIDRGRDVYFPTEAPARPETPVSKRHLANVYGVSSRTVDRWVSRDKMPMAVNGADGCWLYAGAHRRFYVSRVGVWLRDRGLEAHAMRPHLDRAADRGEPIYASVLARRLDVSPGTVNNWVKRGCPKRGLAPMPMDTDEEAGCWTYSDGGGIRLYYESRVRDWLAQDRPTQPAAPELSAGLRALIEREQMV